MKRHHSKEEYIQIINSIRDIIPNCGISHDMISGFPFETEQDHKDTLELMDYVKYDFGFMFAYSERPGTLAARKMKDNIPEKVKKRRLNEIILKQQEHSLFRTNEFLDKTVCVLIEKTSKRSQGFWSGRTTQNKVVVFPKEKFKLGDFVDVKINSCTSATLQGKAVRISNHI